jgi:hypothetical protein
VGVAFTASFAFADEPEYEKAPINYSTRTPTDPMAVVKDAVEKNKTTLEYQTKTGYLEALLRELKISPSSQTLVFSKTSFQGTKISPRHPRAVYFNDDTYVGYVHNGDVLEVVSTDPQWGEMFYTVAQHSDSPKIVRETENCLSCHGNSFTGNLPGVMTRSVFSNEDGQPILPAGTMITTHRAQLKDRWGGWYVTGNLGEQSHMGNTLWQEQDGAQQMPQNVLTFKTDSEELGKHIKLADYLEPTSDVVALMVLNHQVEAHNRITRAAFDTLRALRDESVINEAMGEKPAPGEHSESTTRRIKSACEPLIEYLFFYGEPALTSPISGSPDFTNEFQSRGPRDSKGRSLRDFDLKMRLFKYPCSYLIYSKSMDSLPEAAKDYVNRRLLEVLSGKDTSKPFAHLSAEDRSAILQILKETKPSLRDAWERS